MTAYPRAQEPIVWHFGRPAEILEVAAEWDQMVNRNGYPPFLRARFIGRAVEALGCEGGISVLGRAGEQLVAAGVLLPLSWGRWVCYQPSQLPLGAWVMDRGVPWAEVMPSLMAALPGLALMVSITQRDPLLVERPPAEADVEVLDYVETGWIDVKGSFEDFWQVRGKNLRQNLRKQRKRLEDQGLQLSFDYLTTPAEIDAAFLDFASLESAGWKAAEGTAISVDNAQGTFYRAILADFAARGEAFALRISVDAKPAAVDFGVRDANTLVILKTTYDEGLKAYSPAQLLHEQAFERIFRDQLAKRIEFYGKMMDWHRRWTDQSRMLYHVNAYRTPWLRKLRDLAKRRDVRNRAAEVAPVQD